MGLGDLIVAQIVCPFAIHKNGVDGFCPLTPKYHKPHKNYFSVVLIIL